MSLTASTAKVHSLYAIDALARAAHSQVAKHGILGDINTQPGNCATFLLKLEGVLDGLFQDMVTSAGAEGKVSLTPPCANIVVVMTDIVNSTTPSGTPTQATPTITPPAASHAQPAPGPTSVDPSLQSALLALLSQAANAGQSNGQTPTNTNPVMPAAASAPQLDANSFALLRHLTQTANLGNPGPSSSAIIPPASISSVPSSTPNFHIPIAGVQPGPSQQPSLPYQEDRYDGNHPDTRFSRHDVPPGGREPESYHDDRHEFRGRFRGGFRGRGRGRWDDRGQHRDQERERSPVPKGRRSRSRSPPRSRYGGRRDVKPYSPPHRPSLVAADSQQVLVPPSSNAGKDEFGRDIRPTEDTGSEQDARSPHASASVSTDAEAHAVRAESYHSPVTQEAPPMTSAMNTSVDGHDAGPKGLASFDFATFDFTAPASWEALGTAWQETYGYAPGQQELMEFVANGGMAAVAATVNQPVAPVQQANSWSGPGWRGRGAGRGGFRGGRGGRGGFYPRGGPGGRGRYGYGNVREGQERPAYGGNAYAGETDAIVLGGSDDGQGWDAQQVSMAGTDAMDTGDGVSAGKMQRVGGKWQFVRSDALS
ncbi:hypothetical protein EVG20_g4347 [Dentipellis fragilis]|uniref:Uncharacterized protein n=1 Tax=Dentipellis fragilis TaxID=205917 RepID=A0A4Y9YWD4_9AGAM|nr:hypothetical protein EVG20_g4347 [Dentipellis fragilis]